MKTASRLTAVLFAVALLVGALGGCGTTPLGPTGSALSAPQVGTLSPPIVHLNADGTAGFIQLSSGARLGSATTSPLTASSKIDGNKGGKLTCGRFTLTIPPGAFIGPATVTMTVPDPSLLYCDLGIAPNAANNFKVPVQLTTNIKDLGLDPTKLVTYWYDPVGDQWVALPTTVDAKGENVSTTLSHFSTYATGKAGW